MALPATAEKRLLCPSCGKKGKRVSPVTLRALLKEPHGESIASSEQSRCGTNGNGEPGCKPASGDTGWRFCDSRDCDVVYFAEESDATFTRPQLKVAAGAKETAGERPLCYCFGHSVASIKSELQAKGRSDALDDIRRQMEDPGCRCQVTNPSGSCCLGSVARGIEIARKELGMSVSPNAQPDAVPRVSAASRGEKVAKIGTVISAIAASSCCWLPLVLLAAGVSGVGIAATMETYRPLFIVVTFGFLAAAFYFTYRPRKGAATGEYACCAPEPSEKTGDCCAPSGNRRFSMTSMNKVMLWVVTALAVAFLMFPSYVGLLLGTRDGATVTAGMNRAVVKIEGMTCEGCAALAEKAIRGVPGVVAVEVSYEKGKAVIGAEPCCPIPRDSILKALQAAGYKGTFVGNGGDGTSKNLGAEPKSREGPDKATEGSKVDPDRELVFKVSGFT
jgi:copper chaperone CopZ